MGWTTRVQFSVGGNEGIFLSLPLHPDWLWDPPRLLSNGYQWLLPRE